MAVNMMMVMTMNNYIAINKDNSESKIYTN
jgi:hypothetical protein